MTFLREKFGRWCCFLMAAIGTCIYAFLTFYASRYSVQYASEYGVADSKDSFFVMLLIVVGVILATCLLLRVKAKLKSGGMRVAAILLSVLFGVFSYRLVSDANEWVIADTAQVYLAARDMAQGIYDGILLSDYFRIYPYQFYVSTLFSVIFRIAHSVDLLTVFRLQAVLAGLTVYGVYELSHELWKDSSQDILSVLAAVCFLPIAMYALSFYGECIGTFCCVYALLFFVKMLKASVLWKRILFGGILALLIVIIYFSRGALLIVAIAMGLIALFEMLSEKKIYPLLVIFASMLLIAVACTGVNHDISKRSGADIDPGTPMILGVVMALQDAEGDISAPGGYNGYNNELYVASGFDGQKAKAQGMEDLEDILSGWVASPKTFIDFMKRKQLAQYNEPTYGAIAATWYMEEPEEWVEEIYHGVLKKPTWNLLNILQTLSYLGATVYFVEILVRRKSLGECLIGFVLVGGFLFSMIWETQSRYIYPYMVMTLPCSARGICMLSEWVLQTVSQIGNKNKG